MDRTSYVLCGLAPAQCATYSPVQVQKLFFLLDKGLETALGGSLFNFEPYHYGPFDQEVYQTLETLATEGLVEIELEPNGRWNTYRLTPEGQQRGEVLLGQFPPEVQQFIRDVSAFVRKLSFAQLVSAIYKAYPEMKANSVFQG